MIRRIVSLEGFWGTYWRSSRRSLALEIATVVKTPSQRRAIK